MFTGTNVYSNKIMKFAIVPHGTPYLTLYNVHPFPVYAQPPGTLVGQHSRWLPAFPRGNQSIIYTDRTNNTACGSLMMMVLPAAYLKLLGLSVSCVDYKDMHTLFPPVRQASHKGRNRIRLKIIIIITVFDFLEIIILCCSITLVIQRAASIVYFLWCGRHIVRDRNKTCLMISLRLVL